MQTHTNIYTKITRTYESIQKYTKYNQKIYTHK